MSKTPKPVKKSNISVEDVKDFLKNESDFDFELRILAQLRSLSMECTHTGLYIDELSEKAREFDIRATISGPRSVHLAIECKNIRKASPLLAHCVLRQDSEAYHQIIVNKKQLDPKVSGDLFRVSSGSSYTHTYYGADSIYPANDWVAKSLCQLEIKGDDTISAGDKEIFDRYTQALHSARDLIKSSHERSNEDGLIRTHLILPVLVIPDNRLWRVCYNADGTKNGEPQQIAHVSYKIMREFSAGSIETTTHGLFSTLISYMVSHLEIVSESYLETFIDEYLGRSKLFERISKKSIADL